MNEQRLCAKSVSCHGASRAMSDSIAAYRAVRFSFALRFSFFGFYPAAHDPICESPAS